MLTFIASKRDEFFSFLDFSSTDAKLKLIWKYEKHKIINDVKNRVGFGGRQSSSLIYTVILPYTSQVHESILQSMLSNGWDLPTLTIRIMLTYLIASWAFLLIIVLA
jgi:hypothetical protein